MIHKFFESGGVTPRTNVQRSASALALGLMLCAAAAQPTRAQETALPASAFVDSIGVNVHLSYTSNVYGQHFEDIVKPNLIALGVHHYRDGALLEGGQTSLYAHHNELGAAGIHGEFVFSATSTPAFITEYPTYVDESFEAYEGPNEYDRSGDPNWAATLTAFQKTLYTTVKGNAATADYPVVGPSFGGVYNSNNPPSASIGNLGSYCDYGNGHPYPFGGNGQGPRVAYDTLTWYPSQAQNPSVNIDQWPFMFQMLQPVFQGKTFEATETGWFTGTDANSVDQATQAKYVPRLYAEYFRKGIARTYLYELLDEGTDGHMQHSFGLLNNDGSPKPAFTALQSLIGLLQDTAGTAPAQNALAYTMAMQSPLASVGVNTPQTLHHLLLQKQNGHFFLLIWNDLASSSFAKTDGTYLKTTARDIKVAPVPTTLTFTTPVQSVTLYTYGTDNTLHSSKLAVTSGAASMQITDQVAVLDITPTAIAKTHSRRANLPE